MSKRTWTLKQLEDAIDKNNTVSGVLKTLGLKPFRGNYITIYKYVNILNIDISHFSNSKNIKNLNRVLNSDKILVENSLCGGSSLRRYIIRENILNYQCQKCGNKGIWEGKELRLQIDHINGINNDNRIENLRFLCPNCHTQTITWGRRKKKQKNRCACGETISYKSKFCRSCAARRQKTKINWPHTNSLIRMVNQSSFVAVAKKLGVSDNAIRKRIKNHS